MNIKSIDLTQKKSIAILISFLLTFALSRVTVFLIENNVHFPFLGYDIIDGYHIHHFTYGILIMVTVGFMALFFPDRRKRTWLFALYGIGMGLIFDEFGIWLKLDPSYHQEVSLIAVLVITIILLISAFIEHRYRQIFKYRGIVDNLLKFKKFSE